MVLNDLICIHTTSSCEACGVTTPNNHNANKQSNTNTDNNLDGIKTITPTHEINCKMSSAHAAHIESAWSLFRRIGSPRYVCAPMVEGSALAFRMFVRSLGVQLCYSPMISAKLYIRSSKYRDSVFTTCEGDRPLAVQFCANDTELLVEAAKMVQDKADFIDINFGCPQKIARKGDYGAFLMNRPDLMCSLVSSLHIHLRIPVSCKIRILSNAEETIDIARKLEKSGCSLLAVHGRTKEQVGKKVGAADFDVIRRIKSALNIPVISNGGVETLEDAKRALAITNADAVMASEGLLSNPALFTGETLLIEDAARRYLSFAERFGASTKHLNMHVCKVLYPAMRNTDLRDLMFHRKGPSTVEFMRIFIEKLEEYMQSKEGSAFIRDGSSWYSRHSQHTQ